MGIAGRVLFSVWKGISGSEIKLHVDRKQFATDSDFLTLAEHDCMNIWPEKI
jgi:hypothetical protein